MDFYQLKQSYNNSWLQLLIHVSILILASITNNPNWYYAHSILCCGFSTSTVVLGTPNPKFGNMYSEIITFGCKEDAYI